MTDVSTRTPASPADLAGPAHEDLVSHLRAATVEVDAGEASGRMTGADLCWLAPDVELGGWGVAARIPVDDGAARDHVGSSVTDALQQIAAASDIEGLGPVAFASLTFDRAALGSVVTIPTKLLRRQGGRAWLTTVTDERLGTNPTSARPALPAAPPAPGAPQRVRYAGASAAEIAWLDAVDRAVRRIRSGELDKVVLARDRLVTCDQPFDVPALLHRLRERFPECFVFNVAGLIGASPELLIRRAARRIESLVLAGTAARGRDGAEDHRLGHALLTSAKDLGEHRPAVESVRRTLTPLTSELDVESSPHLLQLANVQHLATSVSGVLRAPVDALTLAHQLHPTAAVGGMPTEAALDVIRELETIDRGRYAGPVGWMDATGDGEFAIALRCAQLEHTRGRLFAGAGIVADSLPESELEETRLKLRAMQSAF